MAGTVKPPSTAVDPATTSSRRPSRRPGGGMRTDIQALRALAVMAVVLYHLWPKALPGGYVGVDVFFVISGFLITDHLLRRHDREGRVGLPQFWAARARRLLPAALTVLLASVILTVLFAPVTMQGQYLRSIIGSALYVENWQLAADAIDYLGQENAPPIAQHYWSLSVEEQFYLVWPLFIMLAAVLATRSRRSPRQVFGIVVVVLAVLSFAVSTWTTATSPGLGYFATYSRMWEFALGAGVALAPRWVRSPRVRGAVWLAAGAALVVVMFAFGPTTVFPGPMALVPTAATAALIAAGPASPFRWADRIIAARPIQWIGDQSYAIYLWHWPLLIATPWVLGRSLSLPTNIAVLVVTMLAAALTRRFVEDPIRFGRRARNWTPRHVAGLSVAAMAIVLVAATAPLLANRSAAEVRTAELSAELPDPTTCHGAHVLLEEGCEFEEAETVAATDVVPALSGLYDDTGGAFRCYDQAPSPEPSVCTLGLDGSDADVRVALVGDSHAAMLVPALEIIAAERQWSVDVYVGRGCKWFVPDPTPDCAGRHDAIDDAVLSGDYDLLVETWRNAPGSNVDDRHASVEALAERWRSAQDRGTTVIAVVDNPEVPAAAQDCLATTPEFDAFTCAFDEPFAALSADPLRDAARASSATLVDFTDAYCRAQSCPMVLGDVAVYRDTHHITASFSATLSTALGSRLESALPND